jgi:predicted glycoside hydrolase/deacetylase ChbG (UPF0249 family)
MQLIVNADDLGYSPSVNQAIINLSDAGKISCASLVVNLPFAQQAMDRVRENPKLAVGVHLNLTKGEPCLPSEQVSSLVGEDSTFYHSPSFFTRAATGMIDGQQVRAELSAQIERVLSNSIRINHLDSHSHWQIIPNLANIMIEMAQTYQVSRIRTAELGRTLVPNRLWLSTVKKAVRPPCRLAQTTYMLSLHQWLSRDGEISKLFSGKQMQRLLKRPGVSLEMVVHVGKADDPDFPQDSLPAKRRQWEANFLQSSVFNEWLQTMGG